MEETVAVTNTLGTDFSVIGMFMQADPIVKAVMLGLAVASIWSWAVIIEKAMTFRKLKTKARRFEEAFWSGKPLDDLYSRTKGSADHPMAKVFVAAMSEFGRGRQQTAGFAPGAQERIDKVMRVTVDRELDKTERQLPVLATIGSAAPFVGLFGTVWGIMNAFQGIAETGDANLAVVAPGIAEALFATAIGLVAAIPAVVGYNRYSAALNAYAVRLEGFAGEFSTLLSRRLDGAA
ncbi:protein TolQ [Parvularcula dongshanensis]|uniref:Tol-Pal system protein TolQ n=1 Tax=Parvularcula dongshanensis TaxID=1173995 RepID=A0A840I687_9PROT|nr:protein TolQ [Parvularcula dongshanensis]MBB4660347.1 biopolymer transport protein TolQ [Parvularcula dongshanensis]